MFQDKPGLAAIIDHESGYSLAIAFDSQSLDGIARRKRWGAKD